MYEKQTWVTGDTVTADKLNHMENGIESAAGLLLVGWTYDESSDMIVLDKTWEQIANSAFAFIKAEEGSIGTPPFYGTYFVLSNVSLVQMEYSVTFSNFAQGSTIDFTTDTPDGYPMAEN